jgi:hypothetical protein
MKNCLTMGFLAFCDQFSELYNFWQLRLRCEKDLTLPHPKSKNKNKNSYRSQKERKNLKKPNSNCGVKEFALAPMNPPFQHPK